MSKPTGAAGAASAAGSAGAAGRDDYDVARLLATLSGATAPALAAQRPDRPDRPDRRNRLDRPERPRPTGFQLSTKLDSTTEEGATAELVCRGVRGLAYQIDQLNIRIVVDRYDGVLHLSAREMRRGFPDLYTHYAATLTPPDTAKGETQYTGTLTKVNTPTGYRA